MSANRQAADIELIIDRLVLHGFSRADRDRIGDAIRTELLTQLGELGFADAFARQGHVRHLNAGSIRTQAGGGAEDIGKQVARAVYGSVTAQDSGIKGAGTSSPGQSASNGRGEHFER